jgi:hypothetical protein
MPRLMGNWEHLLVRNRLADGAVKAKHRILFKTIDETSRTTLQNASVQRSDTYEMQFIGVKRKDSQPFTRIASLSTFVLALLGRLQ